MAWRRLGAKPLSEPIMISLLTHICVTQPHCMMAISFTHILQGYFTDTMSNNYPRTKQCLTSISLVSGVKARFTRTWRSYPTPASSLFSITRLGQHYFVPSIAWWTARRGICWMKLSSWMMLVKEVGVCLVWHRDAFGITGPLCGESTSDWWIPFTKGQ